METPSNGKKKEKYYLYKLVTFKYTCRHSLSFTLIAKTKTRRRKKLQQPQQDNINSSTLDLVLFRPQGGIYRH